jgi:hypothetical protein
MFNITSQEGKGIMNVLRRIPDKTETQDCLIPSSMASS